MNNNEREITEAAVMQSISQNKDILKWFETHPGEHPSFSQMEEYLTENGTKENARDFQILKDFNTTHSGEKYIIQDCSLIGKDGEGRSCLISHGNDVYVGYDGTGKNGWIDNAQGLYMESTKLQRDAADRFDKYVHDYPGLFTKENNVVVTGHSKGGNKAMYVTMSAKYSHLIDKCVALDGQGFSKAAIAKWQKEFSPEVYNEKISKMHLVSGKYDFVHEMGITIAKHTYTVDYRPEGDARSFNLKDWLFSFHEHEYMFNRDENGHLVYNFGAEPGPQEAILANFMKEYMKLDPAEIEGSAPQLMMLMELKEGGGITAADGEVVLPQITGVLWALARTSSGKGKLCIAALLPVLTMCFPGLSSQILAYAIQLGLRMIKNEVNSVANNTAGSQLIMLNVESFVELKSSFETVFNETMEAALYAEKAESLQHDANVCGAISKTASKKAEDINVIMQKVVDSFSTTDKELAKAAQSIGESYLGKEVYQNACA